MFLKWCYTIFIIIILEINLMTAKLTLGLLIEIVLGFWNWHYKSKSTGGIGIDWLIGLSDIGTADPTSTQRWEIQLDFCHQEGRKTLRVIGLGIGGPPEQNARGPQWRGFHYKPYLSGYILCFCLFHLLQLPGHAIHVH